MGTAEHYDSLAEALEQETGCAPEDRTIILLELPKVYLAARVVLLEDQLAKSQKQLKRETQTASWYRLKYPWKGDL